MPWIDDLKGANTVFYTFLNNRKAVGRESPKAYAKEKEQYGFAGFQRYTLVGGSRYRETLMHSIVKE
jgi:hypothetical protein